MVSKKMQNKIDGIELQNIIYDGYMQNQTNFISKLSTLTHIKKNIQLTFIFNDKISS